MKKVELIIGCQTDVMGGCRPLLARRIIVAENCFRLVIYRHVCVNVCRILHTHLHNNSLGNSRPETDDRQTDTRRRHIPRLA